MSVSRTYLVIVSNSDLLKVKSKSLIFICFSCNIDRPYLVCAPIDREFFYVKKKLILVKNMDVTSMVYPQIRKIIILFDKDDTLCDKIISCSLLLLFILRLVAVDPLSVTLSLFLIVMEVKCTRLQLNVADGSATR